MHESAENGRRPLKCPCNNFIKRHFNQYFVNNNLHTLHRRTAADIQWWCETDTVDEMTTLQFNDTIGLRIHFGFCPTPRSIYGDSRSGPNFPSTRNGAENTASSRFPTSRGCTVALCNRRPRSVRDAALMDWQWPWTGGPVATQRLIYSQITWSLPPSLPASRPRPSHSPHHQRNQWRRRTQ